MLKYYYCNLRYDKNSYHRWLGFGVTGQRVKSNYQHRDLLSNRYLVSRCLRLLPLKSRLSLVSFYSFRRCKNSSKWFRRSKINLVKSHRDDSEGEKGSLKWFRRWKLNLVKTHRYDSEGKKVHWNASEGENLISWNPAEIISKDKNCYLVGKVPSVVCYLIRRVPRHLYPQKVSRHQIRSE
jgi:hypothetical protein